MLLRKEKNLAPVVEKYYPLDSAIGFPINTYPLDSEIVIYPVDIAIQLSNSWRQLWMFLETSSGTPQTLHFVAPHRALI